MTGRGREGGFTLLELVIASAVLMVALAIAADLLSESLRLFSGSVVSLTRVREETALRRLAGDLRTLELVAGTGGTWSVLPLELADGDRRVVWALRSGRLVRAARDAASASAAPLLDDLVGFRWRAAETGWVEVALDRRAPAAPLAWRLASAQWRRRDERLESFTLGIAPRRGWR